MCLARGGQRYGYAQRVSRCRYTPPEAAEGAGAEAALEGCGFPVQCNWEGEPGAMVVVQSLEVDGVMVDLDNESIYIFDAVVHAGRAPPGVALASLRACPRREVRQSLCEYCRGGHGSSVAVSAAPARARRSGSPTWTTTTSAPPCRRSCGARRTSRRAA